MLPSRTAFRKFRRARRAYPDMGGDKRGAVASRAEAKRFVHGSCLHLKVDCGQLLEVWRSTMGANHGNAIEGGPAVPDDHQQITGEPLLVESASLLHQPFEAIGECEAAARKCRVRMLKGQEELRVMRLPHCYRW